MGPWSKLARIKTYPSKKPFINSASTPSNNNNQTKQTSSPLNPVFLLFLVGRVCQVHDFLFASTDCDPVPPWPSWQKNKASDNRYKINTADGPFVVFPNNRWAVFRYNVPGNIKLHTRGKLLINLTWPTGKSSEKSHGQGSEWGSGHVYGIGQVWNLLPYFTKGHVKPISKFLRVLPNCVSHVF